MLEKSDYKKICKQLKLYGFRSYKEFIDSGLWKEFRKAMYRKYQPFKCNICNKERELFFLHHKSYKRLLDPLSVVWICKDCHQKIHKKAEKSIQYETDKLFTENNGKKNKRVGSLRIVYSSKLPETLHHSLHACGVVNMVREGQLPKKCLEEYYSKKRKKNDKLMIDLLERYFSNALVYLGTFTTR